VTKYRDLLKAVGSRDPRDQEGTSAVRPLSKKLGRPLGKRRDPEFEQVTAYIRKETHQAVKIELRKNGRQEFSALIEGLLQQWLKVRC
jgi:hypothetical protein